MSNHFRLSYFLSYCIMLYRIELYCTILNRTGSYCITSYCVVIRFSILCHMISYHTISCQILLNHIMCRYIYIHVFNVSMHVHLYRHIHSKNRFHVLSNQKSPATQIADITTFRQQRHKDRRSCLTPAIDSEDFGTPK